MSEDWLNYTAPQTRLTVYQSKPGRVRYFFNDELTKCKLNKLNVYLFKRRICMELTTDTAKGKVKVSDISGIILGPPGLYKFCHSPSYHNIEGALSGSDWSMICISCLLCSSSFFLHGERDVRRAGLGVEGFCFSLVLNGQMWS